MEDLTNDERKRLAECMKDSEFMNLLAEYAKEISDPKHRLENEQYLRQLEQEQGAPLMKDNAVVMIPDAVCHASSLQPFVVHHELPIHSFLAFSVLLC